MENPEKFIKGKYWGSEPFREATEQAALRTEIREGESTPNEPEKRVRNYLKRFTDILDREDPQDREHGLKAIERLLHRKNLVKPESITDDYIKGVLFGNFAEQKGYNRSDLLDPNVKQGLVQQFQSETGVDFDSYQIPEKERTKKKGGQPPLFGK